MGYRSQVYLKTTTEGYLILKRFDDKILKKEDKPLAWAEIKRTSSGFYRIEYDDIKWYDSYPQVRNFEEALAIMNEQEIPYSFIRIGEDVDDIEHNCNWTDDMPSEIETFEPVVDVNDDDCDYEPIDEKGGE